MRRLFSTALVLIVSMSLVFGVSPAFAQTDEENAKQVYAVSDELMEEVDGLVRMLKGAEHENDQEMIKAVQEKIRTIKEKIGKTSEKTIAIEKVEGSEKPQGVVKTPTVTASSQGTVVSSTPIDWCVEVKALKKKHYEALYALSDEELNNRGYHRGKEEIGNTIRNLEKAIERARIRCETGVTSSSGGSTATQVPTETVTIALYPKPVAVESGGEITDYYKTRIAEIATEEVEIEKKVNSLKELRGEIDELIEELIKSKAEINAEEVSGLVTKIDVRPGEVKMGNVVVKTVDKSVVARINNKNVDIMPTETQVIIHDGNSIVKVSELSIENETLRVGTSEVKLRPGTIIEQIKIEPIEIELKEENAKAVYKIKASENRKLLGFIPVKIEKALTVDAENTEVEIIEEESPWWVFMTTR